MIDSSDNRLKVSQETADHIFRIQEESMKQMIKDLK